MRGEAEVGLAWLPGAAKNPSGNTTVGPTKC
jgi:hypothetical protein